MLDIDEEIIVRNVRHMDGYFDADVINELEDSHTGDDYLVGVSVQVEDEEEPIDNPDTEDADDDWDSWEGIDNGL